MQTLRKIVLVILLNCFFLLANCSHYFINADTIAG